MNGYQFTAIGVSLAGGIFMMGRWASLLSKQLQEIIRILTVLEKQ